MSYLDPSLRSPREIILYNFSSQWFLIPQGTSIIAIILYQSEYQFKGLHVISFIFFLASIVFLFGIAIVFATRCLIFPKRLLTAAKQDINELACLASITISLTSIVQMMSLALVHSWGKDWGVAVYVLWWITVAMALLGTVGISFVFIRVFPDGVPHLSPASQLPLISALTTAAAGGTICQSAHLSTQQQIPVIIVSYLLLGIGIPLAFGLDVLHWARLLDRSLPDRQHTYQDMILCGPWSQGSFALQGLAVAVQSGSFANYSKGIFLTAQAAEPVGYISIFAGLLAWGTATFWWMFALLSILQGATGHQRIRKIPFGLVNWAIIFPWGVYTNATVQLGKLLDSTAFRVWSTVLAIILVILWILNMTFTVKGIFKGPLLGLKDGWRPNKD